ncbi:hypothetical protein DTO280E4_9228 [Paecilomyces variotii]|nr:hypothetical protein DTO280E4_9228 [Paecilomyces variotii]KAJ9392933.1 hypothetical protein DTO063F5_70 [Paecilomyces variotii]
MSSALIIYCWNIKPSPSLFLPISLTRMSGCPLFHREIDSWVVPIPKGLQRRHDSIHSIYRIYLSWRPILENTVLRRNCCHYRPHILSQNQRHDFLPRFAFELSLAATDDSTSKYQKEQATADPSGKPDDQGQVVINPWHTAIAAVICTR